MTVCAFDAVASMLYRDYSRKEGEWVPNIHGGRENLEAIAFMQRTNTVAYGEVPGIMMVAEESTAFPGVTREVDHGGLGFGFKWNMGWMNDTLSYMSEDAVHRRYHHEKMTFGLHYAFSENFILPISHDEVVHGKGSMINKMRGSEREKFANLRAYYGFMWGHPGKKLLFMGCEFAQVAEWNHDSSLDWHLLDDDLHAGVQRLVRDLNKLYRSTPGLHELDCRSEGFEWIEEGATDESIFAWVRHGAHGAPPVLVVCNFTPVERPDRRIGVPKPRPLGRAVEHGCCSLRRRQSRKPRWRRQRAGRGVRSRTLPATEPAAAVDNVLRIRRHHVMAGNSNREGGTMMDRTAHRLARQTMAFVLAGGRGSRLYEMTDVRAKPAVYFGGKSRIIDFPLSNAVNSGIRRIGVATQYKAHSLIRHLQRGWSFFRAERNESLDILPASQQLNDENWYKGTADAVYQNSEIIRGYEPKYIVVLAGDHIYKQDYAMMIAHHVDSSADVTVGCIEVPRMEATGFGVMKVDAEDRILDFVEKPANPPATPGNPETALASMGIYVFETNYLLGLLEELRNEQAYGHDFRQRCDS